MCKSQSRAVTPTGHCQQALAGFLLKRCGHISAGGVGGLLVLKILSHRIVLGQFTFTDSKLKLYYRQLTFTDSKLVDLNS